jgi:hypothetical protein
MLEYTLTLEYDNAGVNHPLVMFWLFIPYTFVLNHGELVLIVLPSGKSYNDGVATGWPVPKIKVTDDHN